MSSRRLEKCLSGVIFVIFALISDNVVRTDVNFKSKPTTIKTFENDSVLLPCYATGRNENLRQLSLSDNFSYFVPRKGIFYISVDDEKSAPVMENLIMKN